MVAMTRSSVQTCAWWRWWRSSAGWWWFSPAVSQHQRADRPL